MISVNVARGEIVNTTDLVTALKNNDIYAAGLDVMDPEPLPADHPLMSLPNAGSAFLKTSQNKSNTKI